MIWRLVSIVVICLAVQGASSAAGRRHETGFLDRAVTMGGVEYRYEIYVPRDYDSARAWPIILALHGGGDYGSDGIRPTVGALAKAIRLHPDRFPAIVVFPQAHADGTPGWQQKGGEAALVEVEKAVTEFHGDSSRIYLTGYSAGGNGAWFLCSRFQICNELCLLHRTVGAVTPLQIERLQTLQSRPRVISDDGDDVSLVYDLPDAGNRERGLRAQRFGDRSALDRGKRHQGDPQTAELNVDAEDRASSRLIRCVAPRRRPADEFEIFGRFERRVGWNGHSRSHGDQRSVIQAPSRRLVNYSAEFGATRGR